jgi:hypothetical protein
VSESQEGNRAQSSSQWGWPEGTQHSACQRQRFQPVIAFTKDETKQKPSVELNFIKRESLKQSQLFDQTARIRSELFDIVGWSLSQTGYYLNSVDSVVFSEVLETPVSSLGIHIYLNSQCYLLFFQEMMGPNTDILMNQYRYQFQT